MQGTGGWMLVLVLDGDGDGDVRRMVAQWWESVEQACCPEKKTSDWKNYLVDS